jgi:hypothetical protein
MFTRSQREYTHESRDWSDRRRVTGELHHVRGEDHTPNTEQQVRIHRLHVYEVCP